MGKRFLLDTHTLIWWAFDQRKLSEPAFEAIEDGDNHLVVSAVSAMEIMSKVRLGRMEWARPLATGFSQQVEVRGFTLLSISADHAELAGSISSPHRDPWDRLLAAQSQIERLALLSNDSQMETLGVSTYW